MLAHGLERPLILDVIDSKAPFTVKVFNPGR